MISINDDEITLRDKDNQKVKFITDGNGDYYFTLYSNHEARSGDYYPFIIAEDNSVYSMIKSFVEKEVEYFSEPLVRRSSYFNIDNNSVTIADQNRTRIDAEWVKFIVLPNQIRIIFSEKFPASVRIVGVGRQDHYPFFLPVIDLFDNMQTNFRDDEKATLKTMRIKKSK